MIDIETFYLPITCQKNLLLANSITLRLFTVSDHKKFITRLGIFLYIAFPRFCPTYFRILRLKNQIHLVLVFRSRRPKNS